MKERKREKRERETIILSANMPNLFYTLPYDLQHKITYMAVLKELKDSRDIKYVLPQNPVMIADTFMIFVRHYHDLISIYTYEALGILGKSPIILASDGVTSRSPNVETTSLLSRKYSMFIIDLYRSAVSIQSLHEFCILYNIPILNIGIDYYSQILEHPEALLINMVMFIKRTLQIDVRALYKVGKPRFPLRPHPPCF